MPRCCRPGARQIVEAVPVDPGDSPDQKLGGSLQPELLNLLRAKGRDPNFGDPDRKVGDLVNLAELVGPLVNGPVVPVQREPVYRDYIELVEHAEPAQCLNEVGIDRRDSPQNASQTGIFAAYGGRCGLHQIGVYPPAGIELEIPMRHVVGFIPQLDRLDHAVAPTDSTGRPLSSRMASRYPCNVPT